MLKDFEQENHSVGDELFGPELYESISEAVRLLPPQQQLIYLLKREREWKREQIALELNISPNTVKSSMQLAVRSVKKYVRGKMVA